MTLYRFIVKKNNYDKELSSCIVIDEYYRTIEEAVKVAERYCNDNNITETDWNSWATDTHLFLRHNEHDTSVHIYKVELNVIDTETDWKHKYNVWQEMTEEQYWADDDDDYFVVVQYKINDFLCIQTKESTCMGWSTMCKMDDPKIMVIKK